MNEVNLSRRAFLLQAAALSAGGLLAACTPEPAAQPTGAPPEGEPAAPTAVPAGPSGEPVRFWTVWGGAGLTNAMQEIQASDEWKEALGNNTFEFKDAIENEAMLAAVASGDPPDGGANVEYLDFMARGALMPIDDLVATSTIINKEDFVEGSWEMCSLGGSTYGVPSIEGFLPFGLNYNIKLADEAGLDVSKPPETWAEAYAWHEKLTAKDGAGNLLRIGLNPYGAMGEGLWYAGGWMLTTSWGWQWFNEDDGTFDIDNELMVEALATQKEFIDLVGADNLTSLYSVEGRDTWGGAYNAEVEAMIIEGYWHPGETANDKPEVAEYNRATWLPVPESRRGVRPQCVYTHMVAFFNGAKNPQGMFRLAEVLTTKAACDAFYNNVGWLPPIKPYYATVDPTPYPGLDFYLQSVDKVTEWHVPARCEITAFVCNEYLTIKDKVNRNEMTPAEAAAELQKRCEAEYKAAGFA